MENELDDQMSNPSSLTLSEKGKKDFKTIANWAIFFSVLGFIFSFLMLISAVGLSIASSQIAEFGALGLSSYLVYLYIFFALIYLLPIIYMFRFATKMKGAISRNNGVDFNDAINKLKTHFVIMGVMTIASILIYFIFLASMLGGMASSMANGWAL